MPRKLVEGRGQYVDDMMLPRMVHVAFVTQPARARQDRQDRRRRGAAVAGRAARVHGRRPGRRIASPWVAVLAHLKGMKSAPQLPLPLERATWVGEAVAAVVAESRAVAEDAVAKVKVDYEPLPAVVDMETALDAATAGDPPRARRQPVLPARQRERQGRRGVQRRAQGRGGHLPHRPPHGRDAGAALDPGRLQPRLRQAHRLSRHPGAAHDAGRVRQAHAAARGRRARDLHRRRRQLRHQGARLPRRGGRRRHRQDHGPPRQVHRRPAGELLQRHPRPRPPHQGRAWPSTPRAASPPSTSTT